MDFNGINSYTAATYSSVSAESSKTSYVTDKSGKTSATTSASAYSEAAATYESSVSSSTASSKSNRSAIIAQLKADSQNRINQMQSLVTKMFQKQGITIGTADDMWKTLASGNFTADADTIAQAKADIAEDGYWGVNQTSERIFSFALALSGGDADKMEEMVKAVEKGFGEATKTWGKEMPSITQDTHTAIMDKFDKWFEDNGSDARTEDLLK